MRLRFIVILILLTTLIPLPAQAEPDVVGKAAVLLDLKSGQVLYRHNADEKLPMASTTKVMTVALAMEKVSPDAVATASENARLQEGSSIYLQPGEKLSVKDLYYAILLNSANDAAVVIAEHVAGSVEGFAALMNSKAREIGAVNTNFVNPNGLPADDHYTTAYDLALIARYAMQKPLFREIVSTLTWDIPRDNPLTVKRLRNHNRMLFTPGIKYEGCTGIKTGFTRKAQQCLVSSSRRGSQEMLAVVLGSQGINVYSDAAKLMDFGYENFSTITLATEGQAFRVLPVNGSNRNVVAVAGESRYYTLPKDGTSNVEKTITFNNISAPVKKGQVIGKAVYKINGEVVGSVSLVAQKAVEGSVMHSYWWVWMPAGGLAFGIMLPRLFRRRRARRNVPSSRSRITWLNKDFMR